MKSRKRAQAINGDLVTIEHPQLDLSYPITTYATVAYNGVAHQFISTPDISSHSFTVVTGEFSVGGNLARVVEVVDNVAGKAQVAYQAVLETENGALWTQSHDSREAVAEVMGAVRPIDTPLGIKLEPSDSARIVSAPTVVQSVPGFGIIEAVPLTREVNAALPDWQGSPVAAGELFAGSMSRSLNYLILVTATARVHVLLEDQDQVDAVTATTSDLQVVWQK